MGIIELRGWDHAARAVPPPDGSDIRIATQSSLADRIQQIWPVLVIGLGLLTTVAWMALLGGLLSRAVLRLIE